MERREMTLSGIKIAIIRKNIKNLYIRIKPPKALVEVSVPLYTSDDQIARLLEERWDWILEKRELLLREQAEGREWQEMKFETGEKHLLWGEPHELLVERSLKKPFTKLQRLADNKVVIYMRVTAHSTVEERKKQLDKWYISQMREQLEDIRPRYEEIVGRHAEEWRFRRMKTRWGTCNIQKKRICLNIQLAERPIECLEYVVSHELTHLHEAGHNKRFWGLMDGFYPEWRRVRKQLNEFSPLEASGEESGVPAEEQ